MFLWKFHISALLMVLGSVDGMDALSFYDVFNKHHLGTL
jgi:hypothetical protein